MSGEVEIWDGVGEGKTLQVGLHNTNGTTTGTIYANGTQIGQNTNLTVAPKDLGRTKNDYLGKSQYGDPNLRGFIDQFEINGDIR